MITVRPAWPDEISRASKLCPLKPPQSTSCFVAVQDTPVERIIAAAFCSFIRASQTAASTSPQPDLTVFTWNTLPAYDGSTTASDFLIALGNQVKTSGIPKLLKTHEIFVAGSTHANTLCQAGFSPVVTNLTMEANFNENAANLRRLNRCFAPLSPDWELRNPQPEDAQAIARLAGQQESLVGLSEIKHALENPHSPRRIFDPHISPLLIHRPSGELVGVMLARRKAEILVLPAMVVGRHPELSPGEGFSHLGLLGMNQSNLDDPPTTLRMQINPDRNPTMFRLAQKIGYRETKRSHAYSLRFSQTSSQSTITSDPSGEKERE